jgi:hypothetical protein
MGDIRQIIEVIEAKLQSLGYKPTDEVFDFDSVPNSIMDRAFRIETRMIENAYYSGQIANPKQEISIYIAYKERRAMRAIWKVAYDEMEIIEKELMAPGLFAGLVSDPLIWMDNEASALKYLENYLILRVVFVVDYLRDISQ